MGCSSADIAEATGAKVLLVGKPGVGDAIDSYNLCAAVFEARGLPVLGGVFNKLPETGFVSLDLDLGLAVFHITHRVRSTRRIPFSHHHQHEWRERVPTKQMNAI